MNRFSRRSLMTGAAALGTFAAGLPGQTVPAQAYMAKTIDKPVTISFYNYNLASAGVGADATKKLIADFMAANPNIKVEGVAVVSSEMTGRVQADIVAGRVPDLAQIVFRDLDFAAKSLGAKAYEDIVEPLELKDQFTGMFEPGLQLGVIDKKTYGLAFTFSTPVLFYNADLFRQAGLDPDKPPRTWAEVRAAGEAIAKKTGKHGFFGGIYGVNDGNFVYQSIVMSNGGRAISEDRKKLMFGEPAAIEAVKMLRDMVDSGGHARIDPASHTDTMMSGNLGMFLYTSAVQTALLKAANGKFELRAAPEPSFGDKPTRPTNSGSALFIMSNDPLKQRAAWELLKFISSREGYTVITRDIGYLPLRLDIVDDPKYLGEWIKSNPLMRPNLEQLTRLTPNAAMPGPKFRQIEKIMMDAVRESVFGKEDPAKIMKVAQDDAQTLMPR